MEIHNVIENVSVIYSDVFYPFFFKIIIIFIHYSLSFSVQISRRQLVSSESLQGTTALDGCKSKLKNTDVFSIVSSRCISK